MPPHALFISIDPLHKSVLSRASVWCHRNVIRADLYEERAEDLGTAKFILEWESLRSVLIKCKLKVDAQRWNSHQLPRTGTDKSRYGRPGYEHVWLIVYHSREQTTQDLASMKEEKKEGWNHIWRTTDCFFLSSMFQNPTFPLHRLSSSNHTLSFPFPL